MIENISAVSQAGTKNSLSEQEKRDYYKAWESSSMSKSDFCKEHKLPINSLYYWHKLFKKESEIKKNTRFSPIVAKTIPSDHQKPMIQLEMRLPNQVQLSIHLHENNLVSFIQELCNAVTVIR